MSPREMLKAKARKYRESLSAESINITKGELNFILNMLIDAADCLESYSEHQDFSHEIRDTVKKIRSES